MTSKLLTIAAMSVPILLLSGCSGGGDASFSGGANTVSINDCNATVPKTYTSIADGDALVKDTTLTQVEIIHDSLNNKKVCVLQGSAHIIR